MNFEELIDAADQGALEAQYAVALCYQNGWGVSTDHGIAKKIFFESAKKGYAASQYEVAMLLHTEGDESLAEANNWLRKSAVQGFSPAGYLYSLFCENWKLIRTGIVKKEEKAC